METAKLLLERFWDLTHKQQSSGMNVLSELQELGDMVHKALNEVYDTEQALERQNDLLTQYEQGKPTLVPVRAYRRAQ